MQIVITVIDWLKYWRVTSEPTVRVAPPTGPPHAAAGCPEQPLLSQADEALLLPWV